jgi:predicted amidohydrolase
VIGVNRTGVDPDGTLYSGGSAIFAPDGTGVAPLSMDGENLVFEIDPDFVSGHRKKYPFLPL